MSIHPLSRPFATSEVQLTGVSCCGGCCGRPKRKDRVIARRKIIDSREVLVFFVTPHPRIDQTEAMLQEMRSIVLELQNAYGLPKDRNLPNLPLDKSANVNDAENLKSGYQELLRQPNIFKNNRSKIKSKDLRTEAYLQIK